MRFGDVVVTGVIIGVILLIIVPLSPFLLDVFLVLNISLSLVILLTTMYTKEPLDFSIFPSLLLIVTLFRLALNIASTRLILGRGGQAGQVIRTFGDFVIQGNLIVGFIIFLIIVIVQFIVITKGAERVAEVAARFTLDAMPGKQMAIDADLNSGIIEEQEAKARREKIQHSADFYGAMDGASKFVKGDAIVGIIIMLINAVGGILIGMTGPSRMPFGQVVEIYTLATIGDGLVSQIPALLVSTATGIIVTRNASEANMGRELTRQLSAQPLVLMMAGGALFVINLIPGMPHLPILLLSGGFFYLGYVLNRTQKSAESAAETIPSGQKEAGEQPQSVYALLQVDPIELDFGYGVIPLADAKQGGDLLERVVGIRKQCAQELGVIIPVVRLRDNLQLNLGEYTIKIKGMEVARGEILTEQYLAMNPGGAVDDVLGIDTIEPAFGLPAKWITAENRDRAEILGCTVVDPVSVIATHLSEVLKRHSHEFLGRQDLHGMLEHMRLSAPALVEEVTPKLLSLGEIQKVLMNLLREGVPIRDMTTILETLGDYGGITRDADMLTEYVRQGLKRTITKKFVPEGRLYAITLDAAAEDTLLKGIQLGQQGSYLVLPPDQAQKLMESLSREAARLSAKGMEPVVVTSPVVRIHLRKAVEQMLPDLVILSYQEIEGDIQIHGVGMVSL